MRQQYQKLDQDQLVITDATRQAIDLRLADVLRIWQPNAMSSFEKILEYFGNLWLFSPKIPPSKYWEGFSSDFRHSANGSTDVHHGDPLWRYSSRLLAGIRKTGSVSEAIRESRQQPSRCAINRLRRFGLGFFVYFLGGSARPSSSLKPCPPQPLVLGPDLGVMTLALPTVPVVIVSTEEGLTRIPATCARQ